MRTPLGRRFSRRFAVPFFLTAFCNVCGSPLTGADEFVSRSATQVR
jgi:hypothetical protein